MRSRPREIGIVESLDTWTILHPEKQVRRSMGLPDIRNENPVALRYSIDGAFAEQNAQKESPRVSYVGILALLLIRVNSWFSFLCFFAWIPSDAIWSALGNLADFAFWYQE